MRAAQNKVGKDKLAVLLISVDRAYGMTEQEAEKDSRRIMKLKGVSDWPCVIEPNGWEGVNKVFGIDGYHVFLVGKDGKVVHEDLMPDDLDQALRAALG